MEQEVFSPETEQEFKTVKKPGRFARRSKKEKPEGAPEADGGRKMGKGKLALIIVLAIIAVLVVLRLLKNDSRIDTEPLGVVSVAAPERKDISLETSLVGNVMPGDVYYVIPKSAGEIMEIYVKQGDKVKAGDPICKIDNQKQVDSAKISLDGAEIQMNTAKEGLALAETNLNRMKALYASGDISAQAYEQTKSGYDQAKAAVEGAVLAYEGAKIGYDTQVEFSTVTAPVNGTVESTNMSLNGLASSAAQVCVITSDADTKLQFNVTDRLVDFIHAGDLVRIEKQGKVYDAHISSVATLPGQTGLYPVEAKFDEANNLVQGSSVKLYFDSAKSENTLTVETDCLHYDGGKNYVYTAEFTDSIEGATSTGNTKRTISEHNKAAIVHRVEVETGLSDGEFTEILGGIDEDAVVIRTWTSVLYEGAIVQVTGVEE